MDFFEILYEVRESKGQNQKLAKTNFSEKFSFLGKSQTFLQNEFSGFCQKVYLLISLFLQ